MRLSDLGFRLKRLDKVLPPPKPETRQLTIWQCQGADGEVYQVAVHDGGKGDKGETLFHYRPGDPAEAEAEAFIKASGANVLRICVVETAKHGEGPVGLADAPACQGALEAQEQAPDAREGPPEAARGTIPARDGELAALTAEKAALEERIVKLLVERGERGEVN